MSSDGRLTGKVKFFDSKKGFGFIVADNGDELFFHVTDLGGKKEIPDAAKVTFEVGTGKKGPKAANVRTVAA